MLNFVFQNPTKIVFGRDTTDLVGKETRRFGRRVLLTYGRGSIKRTGLYDRVMDSLKAEGIDVFELGGIQPNPRIDSVRRGVEICKGEKIDFVLAVGGGSVIDAAKAIAAGAKYDGDPWDFYARRAEIKDALPLGTVLTLAATGSEMNGNSVLTNWETREKLAISSAQLYPRFSILDPQNTFSVPREHTAYGAVDILGHVFEQYFDSTPATPLQDRMAEGLMRTVIETLPAILEDPTDYEARATMMWCGTIALNNIIGCGKEQDWATHMIEHELSAIYDIPHGAGLAIVYPQWMKYVLDAIPHKFARFARQVWNIREDVSERELGLMGIERTKAWFKEVGAPVSLKEVGIDESLIDEMAGKAVARGPLGSAKKLYQEDVARILRMCLD